MTETRRIILNTLAAYGRSVLTLPMHLFSARWVLAGLGKDDYGVYSVVGGVVFFITFINAVLSGAASRFYAYSIGRGRNMDRASALLDLKGWFNTTLSIHLFLPSVLLLSYPLAAYAVRHWLTISPDRIDAAIWVLRFTYMTAFVSFLNVPYSAMFSAHQLITELTVFALLTTALTFGFSAWMPYVTGDRLVVYAGGIMFIHIFCIGLLNLRARVKFPAARVDISLMFNAHKLREVFAFAFWKLLNGAAWVGRSHGSAVVLNVYCGPAVNAAMAIGNQLAGQAASFSQSLINALAPAVTTSEGSGDRSRVLALAYRSCKFGCLLVMLFAIPLMVEMNEVLLLWLRNPPEQSAFFCCCMLIVFMIEKLTLGQDLALTASGRIGTWQVFDGIVLILTLPVGVGLIWGGMGSRAIGYAYILSAIASSIGRLYFAQKVVSIPVLSWFVRVLIPVTLAGIFSFAMGRIVDCYLPQSFGRLCLTTLVCSAVLLTASVCFVLSAEERLYLRNKLRRLRS